MRSALVYAICSRTSGLVYVGKTINLQKRLREHRTGAFRGYRSYLANAIRKHGWGDFVVVVLSQDISETRAFALERLWITDLNLQDSTFGYNLTAGGEGTSGHVVSSETRQKMAKQRGWRHGEAARLRISLSKQGRHLTEEHRLTLSKAHRGKKFTKEHCDNMALAARRRWEQRKHDIPL